MQKSVMINLVLVGILLGMFINWACSSGNGIPDANAQVDGDGGETQNCECSVDCTVNVPTCNSWQIKAFNTGSSYYTSPETADYVLPDEFEPLSLFETQSDVGSKRWVMGKKCIN